MPCLHLARNMREPTGPSKAAQGRARSAPVLDHATCVRRPFTATMSKSEPEAFCQEGDAVLVLDSGSLLPVHSAYLTPRSKVLAEAIKLAAASRKGEEQLRVPLPSTPDPEAQLLLTAIYSQRTETLLHIWNKQQLLCLARVCHRFALEELLAMADEACP